MTEQKKMVIQYRVRLGDTLSAIAQRHHTSVDALMRGNAIPHKDILWVGQILRIESDLDALSVRVQPEPVPSQPRRRQLQHGQASNSPSHPFVRAPLLADVLSGKAILQLGMAGPAVQEAQRLLVMSRALSETSMNTGPGLFGPATLKAVRVFQREHRVPPPVGSASGSVHRLTLEALLDLEAARFSQKSIHPAAMSGRFIAKHQVKAASQQSSPDDSTLGAVWNWVWGTLQGDFNKNPSFNQIAVNSFLGLVPLVDQVLDGRDIIAGLRDIVEYYLEGEEEQDRHESTLGVEYELWIWLNVFVIAMGCIPELGSAVKGVFRVIIEELQKLGGSARKLTPKQLREFWKCLFDALKKFGIREQDAIHWLRQLLGKLTNLLDEAARLIVSALHGIQSLVTQAKRLASTRYAHWTSSRESLQHLRSGLDEIGQALKTAHRRLETMKVQVNQWIREQLTALLPSKGVPKLPKNLDAPPPHKQLPPALPPGVSLPKTWAELHTHLSEKAKEAYEQQKLLMPVERLRQLEESSALKNIDGTYSAEKTNDFFEQKHLSKEEYGTKLHTLRTRFGAEAEKRIALIENSIKETNGVNRPNASLGDGTTETALVHELRTGEPYQCKQGHHAKVASRIDTIETAMQKLTHYRMHIVDPQLLDRIDTAILEGRRRIHSMQPSLAQWKQRMRTHPEVWNTDGTSKIKPGWPPPSDS